MTPRLSHILAVALAVVSLVAGVVVLRLLAPPHPRLVQHKIEQPSDAERLQGAFLQPLRGVLAPEPAPPEPVTLEQSPPPGEATPSPPPPMTQAALVPSDVSGSLSFPPGFNAPLPPPRPTDFSGEQWPPTPPSRPRDLAALPPSPQPEPPVSPPPQEAAPQPQQPTPAPAPPAAEQSPPAQEKPGEAVLKPAPPDAFVKPQAPARFNMGDPV
jgi:hypothetical protein